MSNIKRNVMPFYPTEEDEEIMEILLRHYGVTAKNEVLRIGLRAALREINKPEFVPGQGWVMQPKKPVFPVSEEETLRNGPNTESMRRGIEEEIKKIKRHPKPE